MPKFEFKSVDVHEVIGFSNALLDDLERIIAVPRENLTLEVAQSVYVRDGAVTSAVPVVEVQWLARSQELQDAVADLLAGYLRAAGHERAEVNFVILEKERFYR